MNELIDKIIYDALEEDIPTIDVTGDNLLGDEVVEGLFIAREHGVLSGIKVLKRVFEILDDELYIKVINGDGIYVECDDIIAIISGRTKSILKGEMLALNILQKMSGVATLTKRFVDKIDNPFTKILGSRRTTPNLRVLEKQAIIDGGGFNHCMSLSDHVIIKSSHINASGSIFNAVNIIKEKVDQSLKVEVVVNSFEQFLETLHTTCDIITLHNMSDKLIKKCVEHNTNMLLNASGNISIDRISSIAKSGVDFISVDDLTLNYKTLNIELKLNK